MIFGIQIEENQAVRDYLSKTAERLSNMNLVKNPFNGRIISIEPGCYAIDMKPIYPDISYLGFFYLMIVFFFFGKSGWWLVPGIAIAALHIFWSKYFYFYILKVGMKKHSNITPKLLSIDVLLAKLINNLYKFHIS